MEDERKEFANDKLFDLYTHMKMNIKTSSPFCEIHESKYTHYCINCKRAVCEVCKDSFHSTHNLQEKKVIDFDNNKIDMIFKELEHLINTTRVFTEPDKMKRELVSKVNEEFDTLESALKELKKRKMKEIELVFGDNGNAKYLISNIKTTKNEVSKFFNNYNTFFFNDEVKDEDNALFLQAYDIFNIGIGVSKEYISIINQIRAYYQNFEEGKNKKTEQINIAIQTALEEEKKNEIFNTNLLVIDNSESNTVDIRGIGDNIEETSIEDGFKVKVVSNFEKLGEDLFKELKERLEKTTEFINNFKLQTYNSFKKHGSLVDIEKIVKAFDEKTNKRTNFIKGKANLKFSPSQAKAYSITGALPSQAKIVTQSQKMKISASSDDNNKSENDTKLLSNNNALEKKTENNVIKLGKNGKPSKIYQTEQKKPDSKLLKDIKSEDIPKIKLTHFGQTNQKKNIKSLLESVFNPGIDSSGLAALEEHTEEDVETVSKNYNKEDRSSGKDSNDNDDIEEQDNFFGDDDDENNEVKLENGFNNRKKDKTTVKLEKMFKPIMRVEKKISKPKQEKKTLTEEEKKYKVNNKLQEMIKENQRLCSMIKKYEDINLIISTIRRYYSYQALEFIRKSFYKINKGYSSNLLFASNVKEETNSNDNVKVFEGTNEIQIYDRENRKLIRKQVQLDKKIHGSTVFLNGCRTYYFADKLYISGGRDLNEDKNFFWLYNLKDSKLSKLPNMNKARSYHTITFHENLKSIVAVGGENNKTCEMYDFFLNAWNELPELNVPRANISLHIDKIGTFAYAVGGMIGSISIGQNSDVIELLDLVDINQGWAKVDYRNKANVDLKFCHTGVYPLTDDKLLIYGGLESRNTKKCYVIFDLRSFDILPISCESLEVLKLQSTRSPELSKIFSV